MIVSGGHAEPTPPVTAPKPRVIFLTDVENEPDDAISLVRFLVYSTHWDTEGLVATTSAQRPDRTAAWRIREIVAASGEVRANLETHKTGFPLEADLQSVEAEGRPEFGMSAVGIGKESTSQELIITAATRADTRPLWVCVWGPADGLE